MSARIVASALVGIFFLPSSVAADSNRINSHAAPNCADSASIPARGLIGDHDAAGRIRLDGSRPVAPKSEIIKAWQKRQDGIRSLRFVWTEVQCRPRGWVPNPRYPERERLAIPALLIHRTYTVAKSLSVEGTMMRYSVELDRKEEPDGIVVKSPRGENRGLGVRRHYSYLSVFDGQRGESRLSSLMGPPPAAIQRLDANTDAQNLDTRAIFLAFRPLDRVMGSLLLERAVTNERRSFNRGRSTFLLEERHDPSGWKTILWIEPERDFLVSRFAVLFEQKWIVDMDIDYRQDPRWGWIPSGWRITEMLADGSRRLISEATVSSYSINVPIGIAQFR